MLGEKYAKHLKTKEQALYQPKEKEKQKTPAAKQKQAKKEESVERSPRNEEKPITVTVPPTRKAQ